MTKKLTVAWALTLFVAGCASGGQAGSGDEPDNSRAAGSGFCATILSVTDDLDRLEEAYEGDDYYGELADLYRQIAADAPRDLEEDLALVIAGFDAIGEWTRSPEAEYPFTEAEDAALAAGIDRINAAIDRDCDIAIDTDEGADTNFGGDDGTGSASLGGDLPNDFPFPVPDIYELSSVIRFDDVSGRTFNAVLTAPADDFDALKDLYEGFLHQEGFEVSSEDFSSSESDRFVLIGGERDDVLADVVLSTEEASNANGDVVRESVVTLSWMPQG